MKTPRSLSLRAFVTAALLLISLPLRAQTPADIPPGLVAWWRTENNALDSLGANHGTLKNGVAFTAGKVGQACTFDGVDDYIEVPDSPSLRITDVVSIEFWAKRNALDRVDVVLEKSGDWTQNQTTCGVGLHTNANSNAFYFFFAGGGRMVEGVHDLNWHHYAVVARSGGVDPLMFIDAVPKAISVRFGSTGPMSFFPSALPLHLGAQVGTSNYFGNLWLDEAGIYNRALTASEVAAIHSAGAAGKNAAKPYFLTLGPLPDGGVGTPYSFQFATAVAPGPYTFSVVNGILPPGLELTTNGLLYGTPTVGTTNRLSLGLGMAALQSAGSDILFWRTAQEPRRRPCSSRSRRCRDDSLRHLPRSAAHYARSHPRRYRGTVTIR